MILFSTHGLIHKQIQSYRKIEKINLSEEIKKIKKDENYLAKVIRQKFGNLLKEEDEEENGVSTEDDSDDSDDVANDGLTCFHCGAEFVEQKYLNSHLCTPGPSTATVKRNVNGTFQSVKLIEKNS